MNPSQTDILTTSWCRTWSELGAEGEGEVLREQLVAAYQEPQRKYHTLQHLTECLILLAAESHLAHEPAEVEIALWFHDAIYDVRAHDNELRSAAWAADALACAGVSKERIERVRQLILATQHVELPQTADLQLLVDIDLAILGAEPERFDEYERQVRAEYAWVPEPIFRQKRAEILGQFLARPSIYHTASLRDAREHQARKNLAASIRQ